MSKRGMIDKRTAKVFIMAACIAAIFGGLTTLLIALKQVYGFDKLELLDVAIFFGLAYGVYKRSRVCAIVLFTYHLANRVPLWTHTHSVELTFGGLAIPFMVVYFLGILGTFAHYSLRMEEN